MNPVFDGHVPCGMNFVVLTEDSRYLSGGEGSRLLSLSIMIQ